MLRIIGATRNGGSVPPRVRRRRPPAALVRPARGGRSGRSRSSTRTRTSGPTIPTASSRRSTSCSTSLAPVDARALVFPMHEPDGYRDANDMVLDRVAAARTARCARLPGPAEGPRRGRGGAALPRRRRVRHQAAPARRAVHALRAVGARPRGRRARAPRHGPDPRRPRHPRARAGHRAPGGGVPGRAADPRPLRDLRPRVAVARAAAPPERVHRHRVVEPGRHHRDVLARARRPTSCGRATRPTACRWSPRRRRCAARSRPGCRRSSCAASWAGRWSGCSTARTRSTSGRRPGRRRSRSTRCSTASPPTSRRRWAAPSRRVDFSEPLALSRLACAVGDDSPVAPICSAVLDLLDDFDEHLAPPEGGQPDPRRRAPAGVRADRRPHARRAAARPPGRAARDARRRRGARAELAVFAAADLDRRGVGAAAARLRLRLRRRAPQRR